MTKLLDVDTTQEEIKTGQEKLRKDKRKTGQEEIWNDIITAVQDQVKPEIDQNKLK